jgi:hypothetical protein
MKPLDGFRRPMVLGISAVLLIVAILLLLLLARQSATYGCDRGISTPSIAARDLAAFNAVLASDPAFKGLRATAVHGHEVDVTDSNVREGTSSNDNGPQDRSKYNLVGGISDKLRDSWVATFVRLHPHAWNARIVTIDVTDNQGRWVMGISVPRCTMP